MELDRLVLMGGGGGGGGWFNMDCKKWGPLINHAGLRFCQINENNKSKVKQTHYFHQS